uniref:RNA methyltransferase n=2 Tax=Culicoides sonorensis TaxID=179676 RepID=A0A336N0R9_CULSO
MTLEMGNKEKITPQNRFSTMISPEPQIDSKRIEDTKSESHTTQKNSKKKNTNKFIYGNYNRYYGYRKGDKSDPRIKIFEGHSDLFSKKDILDIGCNDGSVTLEIASKFEINSITGIDIDKKLIGKAKNNTKFILKKNLNPNLLNVKFEVGNYIDEKNSSTEIPRFDTILCLSVTKWIHLNFGDHGIKMMFKRIFAQLRDGGCLILEAQPFEGYRRRKKLTEDTLKNYKNMKLFPKDFKNYLFEIGFTHHYYINDPRDSKGFDRPIEVYVKQIS